MLELEGSNWFEACVTTMLVPEPLPQNMPKHGLNLFDKRYFPDFCCIDRVTPGEPRNWRLSLTRSF